MDISVYQTLFIVLHAFKVLNCIAYSFQSIDQSHVRFTAPLLDEGYTHAVNEYRSGEIKKKPLLLYLPGAFVIEIEGEGYRSASSLFSVLIAQYSNFDSS